jgi:hypothetical protein
MASTIDELEQLGKLLDRGVLTQAEFEEQKGRLLGSAAPASSVPPPPDAARTPGASPLSPDTAPGRGQFKGMPKGLSPKLIGGIAAAGIGVAALVSLSSGHKPTPAPTSGDGSATTPAADTAAAAGSTTPAGAPDEQTIKDQVLSDYGVADGEGWTFTMNWKSIDIESPRTISIPEAGETTIPYGTTIYPVRAAYERVATSSQGSTPSDHVLFLMFYKDDFGKWAHRGYSHTGGTGT